MKGKKCFSVNVERSAVNDVLFIHVRKHSLLCYRYSLNVNCFDSSETKQHECPFIEKTLFAAIVCVRHEENSSLPTWTGERKKREERFTARRALKSIEYNLCIVNEKNATHCLSCYRVLADVVDWRPIHRRAGHCGLRHTEQCNDRNPAGNVNSHEKQCDKATVSLHR